MDRVLSSAIAALLFIHTACGCCWHHAHQSAACGHTQLPGLAGACHHEKCPPGDESSDGPCRCRLECQGVCTYLPPQKTRLDSPQVVVPFDLVAAVSASAEAHSGSAWHGGAELHSSHVGPPLRLHLLHQIFLI